MNFKTILFLLFCSSLLLSCQCKRYVRYADGDDPIFSQGKGYLLDICKGVESGVVLPEDENYYFHDYKLPNDSIATGYWVGINIRLKNDTFQVITAGKGSEFWAGKCKFRVIEVEPRQLWSDSTETDFIFPHVVFQLLKLPKHCPCQNRKLKKFDLIWRKASQFIKQVNSHKALK